MQPVTLACHSPRYHHGRVASQGTAASVMWVSAGYQAVGDIQNMRHECRPFVCNIVLYSFRSTKRIRSSQLQGKRQSCSESHWGRHPERYGTCRRLCSFQRYGNDTHILPRGFSVIEQVEWYPHWYRKIIPFRVNPAWIWRGTMVNNKTENTKTTQLKEAIPLYPFALTTFYYRIALGGI